MTSKSHQVGVSRRDLQEHTRQGYDKRRFRNWQVGVTHNWKWGTKSHFGIKTGKESHPFLLFVYMINVKTTLLKCKLPTSNNLYSTTSSGENEPWSVICLEEIWPGFKGKVRGPEFLQKHFGVHTNIRSSSTISMDSVDENVKEHGTYNRTRVREIW